jgi:riboflavin kinase / FMN adenylyltransferase
MSRFELLVDPPALAAPFAAPVLAIGNFDGVHLGHQALISAAKALAATLGRPAGLLTFEPHSRAFMRPEVPFFSLTARQDKAELAARAGLDGMVVLTFDDALRSMSAEDFAGDLLKARLGVSGVVIGENFRYARAREGDAARLAADGERYGFRVEVLGGVKAGDALVSSTIIREALKAGEVEKAARLLGHYWFVRAPVAHGDKRGRELGYPTANMILPPSNGLAHGIYAVRARVDGQRLDGVASFGRRPTFDDGAPRLETFLFDFSGDLYGKEMVVEFIARLRGEERFSSIEALIAQMDRDSFAARAAIAAIPAAGIGSIL